MKRHLSQWLKDVLMRKVWSAQDKEEAPIRSKAYDLAVQTSSGLGGLKDARFVTPRPWLYETSYLRRVSWRLIWLLDYVRTGHRPTQYVFPLRLGEYKEGKWIIFHTGVQVEKCGPGETTTCSRAYFDPFPGHP